MSKITLTSAPETFIQYFKKIWKFRSLISTFARRDLKVKYAQTVLGVTWTILQPATALFLFTFFFGYILKWKTGNLPFALYVYSGLLGWNFFSYIVYQGTSSIHESSTLIKKVYFPKLILPLSKILVAFVELGINILLLIVLMIWFGEAPSWRLIFLPVILFFNILAGLSIVLWAGALSYRFRDLFHLVPFIMYFGIWITPVFFTFNTLPTYLQFIWQINPFTGIVEGWRWCLFTHWTYNINFLPSLLMLLPICIGGLWLYMRNESSFSDYI